MLNVALSRELGDYCQHKRVESEERSTLKQLPYSLMVNVRATVP